MDYSKYIANIPNFPIEGILFRDVTPLVEDGEAFKSVCQDFAKFCEEKGADIICGPEARGFIFGCPVATMLGKGFVPVRKPGKLPRECISESYDLEYGKNVLSMHKNAIKPGQKVVIIDDLLATGGTIRATINLIEKLGGIVVGICAVIELIDLNPRKAFEGYDVFTLLEYKEFE